MKFKTNFEIDEELSQKINTQICKPFNRRIYFITALEMFSNLSKDVQYAAMHKTMKDELEKKIDLFDFAKLIDDGVERRKSK